MVPREIIIHHSLTVDGPMSSVAAIRKYHTGTKGWKDIGYHVVIDMLGYSSFATYEAIIGRPWTEDGAHTLGHNSVGLGICMIGNFDQGSAPFKQIDATARLCKWLMEGYHIGLDAVLGHREADTSRTCPGAHFDMNVFRALIAAL